MTDSGSSPGSSGSPKEILDVFLFPDVGLDLKVDYPKDTEGSAGRFVVTGPKRKVDILRYVAEGIDDDGEIDDGADGEVDDDDVHEDEDDDDDDDRMKMS